MADFLPLLAFFAVYKKFDIFRATAVLIVLTVVSTAYKFRRDGKIDALPLFMAILMVVFGGLTVYFQNAHFLMWKPTLAYSATAIFFAISCFSPRPMLERMLGGSLSLTHEQWRNGTWAYVAFFSFSAVLNLVVAYNVDLDTWVKFKVFGFMTLSLGFMVSHAMWLSGRQVPQPPELLSNPPPVD